MALDFNQLQQMLTEATANGDKLAELRRLFAKLEVVVGDINSVLANDYQPVKKERKQRVPKALGTDGGEVEDGEKKKPGRPKKKAVAEHAE